MQKAKFKMKGLSTAAVVAAGAAALALTSLTGLRAQSTAYATDPKSVAGANGSSGANLDLGFFATADANVDNMVSRAELRMALEKFLADADTDKTGSAT